MRSASEQIARAGRSRREASQRLVLVVEQAVEGVGRRLAGDRVIERGGKAVDVGPRPLLGRGHLLGRRVARREDRRHRRRAADHGRARGAEIDQGRAAVGIELRSQGGIDTSVNAPHPVVESQEVGCRTFRVSKVLEG